MMSIVKKPFTKSAVSRLVSAFRCHCTYTNGHFIQTKGQYDKGKHSVGIMDAWIVNDIERKRQQSWNKKQILTS